MFGAYLSEQLVSVIAARSEGTHITPIFRRCKRIPLLRPGFFGGLCGLAVCILLIFLQKQLKKQAFSNMDKYIQTFILSEKS